MTSKKKMWVAVATAVAACLLTPLAWGDYWPFLEPEITEDPHTPMGQGTAFSVHPVTGMPCVAYCVVPEAGSFTVKYACYDASQSVWQKETVAEVEGRLDPPVKYCFVASVSLAFTSGANPSPRVAFSYSSRDTHPYPWVQCAYLYYAYKSGESWVLEELWAENVVSYLVYGFLRVSLALADDDIPGMAFTYEWKEDSPPYDEHLEVHYVVRDAETAWPYDRPDPIEWWEDDSVGGDVSLCIADDQPRVAYHKFISHDGDPTTCQVKYAEWDDEEEQWDIEIAASGESPIDLALDPFNAAPRIAHSAGSETIVYTAKTGGNWTTTLVAGTTQQGYPTCGCPSLAIDPNTGWGKIAYVHLSSQSSEDVRAKCYDGSDWVSTGSANVSDYITPVPIIALDPTSGMPWALVVRTGEGLVVAHQLSFGGSGEIDQQWFKVQDDDGNNLVLFGSKGDVVITKGELFADQDPMPDPDSEASEFIVKDSSGDAVAFIECDTGDMYLDEDVTDDDSDPTPQNPAFIIRDSENDNQSFIDDQGEMHVRGYVYERGVQQNY